MPEKEGKEQRRRAPVIVYALMICLTVGLLLVGFVYILANTSGPQTNDSNDSFELCLSFDDFVVPNQPSSYICKGFILPSDTDYHITEFTPIQDNEDVLLHMILYETQSFVGSDYFSCNATPPGSTPLFAWTVGMQSLATPPNVGFPVGKSSGKFVALQILYDNPNQLSDQVDSSGVRLSMTSNLRPIDAGIFMLGVESDTISIPAGQSYYELTGTCSDSQTSALPPASSINPLTDEYVVFSSGLHMLSLGIQIYTDQFRADPATGDLVNIGLIGCDDYFSFSTEESIPINETTTIEQGDMFITHCIYNSLSQSNPTPGCSSPGCEMCMNYLAYYPSLKSKGNCLSAASQSPNTIFQNQCS